MISREKRAGTINGKLRELKPQGTPEFPCAGYCAICTDHPDDIVSWHWHEELEIIYVAEGRLKVKISSKSFSLEKGDCIVINSNMLHYAVADGYCERHALVFHSELIEGNNRSVFAEKYMVPLLSCNFFSAYCIRAADRSQIVGWFNEAFEVLEQENYGFEFIVREKLSRICLSLYQKFESQMDIKDVPLNQNNLRVRKMLTYIQNNFSENLSLEDIAKAADISERECLRCFKKTIQISPVQYLLKYRVAQGAEMLLSDPTGSIAEIASACGFDSPSNFAKMFKRFYDCTPREYRKSHL